MVPTATVLGPRPRPRWPLVIAVLGLGCALLPFHCSVHVGRVQKDWSHGGALFGGVVAMLFATYALLRRRGPLGPRGRAALALLAIGAATAIVGAIVIERVYLGPSLMPAADRVLALARAGQIDQILAEADPALRADDTSARAKLAALAASLHDNFATTTQTDWGYRGEGVGSLSEAMTLARGALELRLDFRLDDGQPRLTGLDVHPIGDAAR